MHLWYVGYPFLYIDGAAESTATALMKQTAHDSLHDFFSSPLHGVIVYIVITIPLIAILSHQQTCRFPA